MIPAPFRPGFVWRLQTEEGDATGIDHFGADMIVNMSVWEDVQTLHDFVYRSVHVGIMRRRKEWSTRCVPTWRCGGWVPAGHRPSLEEAEARLRHLREHGPTARAFTFKQAFPAPDVANVQPATDFGEPCPAP